MKHTITTTTQQESALQSLVGKYNVQQKTSLSPTEFLSLIALSPINEGLSRMDEDEVSQYTTKFRLANKTKRDQVKALLP